MDHTHESILIGVSTTPDLSPHPPESKPRLSNTTLSKKCTHIKGDLDIYGVKCEGYESYSDRRLAAMFLDIREDIEMTDEDSYYECGPNNEAILVIPDKSELLRDLRNWEIQEREFGHTYKANVLSKAIGIIEGY